MAFNGEDRPLSPPAIEQSDTLPISNREQKEQQQYGGSSRSTQDAAFLAAVVGETPQFIRDDEADHPDNTMINFVETPGGKLHSDEVPFSTDQTAAAAAAAASSDGVNLFRTISRGRSGRVSPTGHRRLRSNGGLDGVSVGAGEDFLSKATQHEQEAIALIQIAMKEEQVRLAQEAQQDDQEHEQVHEQQDEHTQEQESSAAAAQMDGSGHHRRGHSRIPSLAETAQYLAALQTVGSLETDQINTADIEASFRRATSGSVRTFGEGGLSSSIRESWGGDDDDDDLNGGGVVLGADFANMHPVDRMHTAGAVLKAAAAWKRRISRRRIGAEEEEVQQQQVETKPSQEGQVAASVYQEEPEATAGGGEAPAPLSAGENNGRHASGLFVFPRHIHKGLAAALDAGKTEWHSLSEFFQPKKRNMREVIALALFAVIIPSLLAACAMFYFAGNPPTGRCNDDQVGCGYKNGEPNASGSWWVLFLGVRQVLLWLLAKFLDVFMIDWLLLQHPLLVRISGAQLSLIFVQSKGWPSVLFWWGILDFCLLYGRDEFSDHWGYWQDKIGLFNSDNPAGNVLYQDWYMSLLIVMVIIPCVVSLKRHFLGLHLGKRLYLRFHERLEETMKEITAISELAIWARKQRDKRHTFKVWAAHFEAENARVVPKSTRKRWMSSSVKRGPAGSNGGPKNDDSASLGSSAAAPRNSRYGSGGATLRTDPHSSIRNDQVDWDVLLDEWTEPKAAGKEQGISGHKIIEFKQAFAVMTKPFFFSGAFGPVGTREECDQSADRLFRRLLKLFEETETINVRDLTKWMFKGCRNPEDQVRAMHLSILLCPDSDDRLSVVDFVRGVDEIYKKVRLIENSVLNASHVDRAYEKVLNVIFYFIVLCAVLAIFGLNPFALLLSVSSLIVSFAFLIGPGAAAFFEGVMMVLGRQPYDIGDRISIAIPNASPDFDGSPQWQVESVDLVTTTARLVATGEVASFSNGALARCRIINAQRSPGPAVYVTVKFGTDIPYSTIQIFRSAVQKFVDDRPQEWVSLAGFRPGNIEAQRNYVEYTIVLCHRQSWQSMITIWDSRAAVASFCVELQKQLGCRYVAPPMPVDIRLTNNGRGQSSRSSEVGGTFDDSEEGGNGGEEEGESKVMTERTPSAEALIASAAAMFDIAPSS